MPVISVPRSISTWQAYTSSDTPRGRVDSGLRLEATTTSSFEDRDSLAFKKYTDVMLAMEEQRETLRNLNQEADASNGAVAEVNQRTSRAAEDQNAARDAVETLSLLGAGELLELIRSIVVVVVALTLRQWLKRLAARLQRLPVSRSLNT